MARPYSKEQSIGPKRGTPVKEKKQPAKLKRTPLKKQSKKMVGLRAKINLSKKVVRIRDKNICQGCGATEHDDVIDVSHTVSEADCKGLGREELMHDVANLYCMCQHRCHRGWGDGDMKTIKTFRNYNALMDYTKENNPQRYVKLILKA